MNCHTVKAQPYLNVRFFRINLKHSITEPVPNIVTNSMTSSLTKIPENNSNALWGNQLKKIVWAPTHATGASTQKVNWTIAGPFRERT